MAFLNSFWAPPPGTRVGRETAAASAGVRREERKAEEVEEPPLEEEGMLRVGLESKVGATVASRGTYYGGGREFDHDVNQTKRAIG
jgi:hypothetical protein